MGWRWESLKGVSIGSAFSGAAALITGPIASTALNCAGFTAIGPAAGSLAAGWMSSIAIAKGGAVPAGCLFSTLQAMGMTGGAFLGPPGLICVGVAGAVAYFVARPKASDNHEPDNMGQANEPDGICNGSHPADRNSVAEKRDFGGRPDEGKSTSEYAYELSITGPSNEAHDYTNMHLSVAEDDLTTAGSILDDIPSAPPLSSEYLTIVADLCPSDLSKQSSFTEKNDEKDKALTTVCVICLDSPLEAVCIPCGHIAGCVKCV